MTSVFSDGGAAADLGACVALATSSTHRRRERASNGETLKANSIDALVGRFGIISRFFREIFPNSSGSDAQKSLPKSSLPAMSAERLTTASANPCSDRIGGNKYKSKRSCPSVSGWRGGAAVAPRAEPQATAPSFLPAAFCSPPRLAHSRRANRRLRLPAARHRKQQRQRPKSHPRRRACRRSRSYRRRPSLRRRSPIRNPQRRRKLLPPHRWQQHRANPPPPQRHKLSSRCRRSAVARSRSRRSRAGSAPCPPPTSCATVQASSRIRWRAASPASSSPTCKATSSRRTSSIAASNPRRSTAFRKGSRSTRTACASTKRSATSSTGTSCPPTLSTMSRS